MSGHTPGPWKIKWNPKTVSILDEDYRYITENVRPLPSQEANALLIAASPDLLEACKVARDEMVRTVAPRDSFTDAVDQLDAAIAKAEGR